MKERIQRELNRIQEEEDITIHFACESGSRGWGFPSPDSDYDVRFIYARPQDWYLSIEKRDDFIELPVFDNLDIGGWDIKKALVLLYGCNSVVFEWLQSPVVYLCRNGFREDLFKLAEEYFSPRAAVHHYLGLCKKSLLSGVGETEVKIKKYFYVLRPLLAAMWIIRFRQVPPMEFGHLLELLHDRKGVLELIIDLLEQKKTARESEIITVIPALQTFIHEQYDRCKYHADQMAIKKQSSEKLDVFFRRIVKQ